MMRENQADRELEALGFTLTGKGYRQLRRGGIELQLTADGWSATLPAPIDDELVDRFGTALEAARAAIEEWGN